MAAVAVGLAWSLILAIRTRHAGRLFERYLVTVVGLFVAASLVGALDLLVGARPADPLHLLYGGAAIVAIPIARTFMRRGGRDSVVALVAFVVLVGIIYRLFATG